MICMVGLGICQDFALLCCGCWPTWVLDIVGDALGHGLLVDVTFLAFRLTLLAPYDRHVAWNLPTFLALRTNYVLYSLIYLVFIFMILHHIVQHISISVSQSSLYLFLIWTYEIKVDKWVWVYYELKNKQGKNQLLRYTVCLDNL